MTLSALLALPTPRASAFVKEHFWQELPTVDQKAATDFFYEQSPQGTVPYGDEAAELSEGMSKTYEAESDGQPVYGEIAADTAEGEEAVGLIPQVAAAVPYIAAAGGAFAAGWEIGEGVNAIFADIGLGPFSAPEETFAGEEGWEFCYSEACSSNLHWYPYGSEIYFGATVQQKPGAYLYAAFLEKYKGAQNWGPWDPVRWAEPPCSFSGFSAPPGAQVQVINSEVECYNAGYHEEIAVYPYVTLEKILSQDELHSYDPLTDGTPTDTSKAPANPGTATVEERAEEYLDENEVEQDYLTEKLEAEPSGDYFPAPAATEKKVKEEERYCDRGTPAFRNLGGNESPGPFATKESEPFAIADLPPGVESPSPVYLRWGTTKFKKESPYMDEWLGWGYRKIRAKHGWNELDRLETEEALETPQEPKPAEDDKWRYSVIDEQGGKDSVGCERVVFVEFTKGKNKITKEEDPAPRGIVSSYNEVVGDVEIEEGE